jgi:formate dehydrogenase iron-sulfur subunit
MTDTVALSLAIEHAPTPIDDYLRRQRELTAVERFAARSDHATSTSAPASARWWQDRLPATPPGPGQQYGFRVDLDACTGCKACVSACHSLNGLQPEENWRTVGTLRAPSPAGPLHRTVTSACHHCVEPACMEGCPANAYEKDPITGIVKHLDDSCIGCSYCTLTCPYEVPRFDADLGIVRKCDMCADRLSEGEAPACVQGCPTGAITIDIVDVDELVAEIEAATKDASGAALVPGAPASILTVPSTRYVSSEPLPDDLLADDHASVHPGHGHTPLAVMLVLTQVSVGAFLLDGTLRISGDGGGTASVVVALLTGLLALGASVLHLGRPLLAWRAFLGLGHSWLSREIAAFSVFALAASAWALAAVLDLSGAGLLGILVALSGLAGVGCSVAIYATTGRWWWRWSISSARFSATMAAGGALLVAATTALANHGEPVSSMRGPVVLLAAVASIGTTLGIAGPLLPLISTDRASTAGRTRRLLVGPLRVLLNWRVTLGLLGGIVLPWLGVATLTSAATVGIETGVVLALATIVTVAAELIERRLFFLASVAPRMPGMAR